MEIGLNETHIAGVDPSVSASVAMSWSICSVLLHTLTAADLASFASMRHDFLPAEVPPSRPLPSVQDVLAALSVSGTYGDYWFKMSGRSAQCLTRGGDDRYLGEISLHSGLAILDEVDESTRVTGLSFRKGSGSAIRDALHALSKTAGDVLVFDGESVLIVSAADDPQSVAERWPFAP